MLEKFTTISKNLDLILNNQKACYNKTGLGYKSNSNKTFKSLITQYKSTNQVWVPKACLTTQVGINQYYIPKEKVYYINSIKPNKKPKYKPKSKNSKFKTQQNLNYHQVNYNYKRNRHKPKMKI